MYVLSVNVGSGLCRVWCLMKCVGVLVGVCLVCGWVVMVWVCRI